MNEKVRIITTKRRRQKKGSNPSQKKKNKKDPDYHKEDPKKPHWYKPNYVSLLNIPDMMRKFGPLVNLWDGGGKGEKYIQNIKPEIQLGVHKTINFFRNKMFRIYVALVILLIEIYCNSFLSAISNDTHDEEGEPHRSNDTRDEEGEPHRKRARRSIYENQITGVMNDEVLLNYMNNIMDDEEISDNEDNNNEDTDNNNEATNNEENNEATNNEDTENTIEIETYDRGRAPIPEQMQMKKTKAFHIYKDKESIIEAHENLKPVVFLVKLDDTVVIAYWVKSKGNEGNKIQLLKVEFDDGEGIFHCGVWYSPWKYSEESINITLKSSNEIEEIANMSAVGIPMKYINKQNASKYTVITNLWKERQRNGSFEYPGLDKALYSGINQPKKKTQAFKAYIEDWELENVRNKAPSEEIMSRYVEKYSGVEWEEEGYIWTSHPEKMLWINDDVGYKGWNVLGIRKDYKDGDENDNAKNTWEPWPIYSTDGKGILIYDAIVDYYGRKKNTSVTIIRLPERSSGPRKWSVK